MNIFSNYISILEQESSEKALLYLYESLINLLDYPKKCELFLDSVHEDYLSSDAIVHILNALSPIKEEIENWDDFVELSRKKLISTEGEKDAEILMGVIL